MSLLSLTACTLLLCFGTSCAKSSYDNAIEEAEKALAKDWKTQGDVIIRLIEKVDKLDKSLATCETRLDDFRKTALGLEDSQKVVRKDYAHLDSKLSKCCGKPTTGPTRHLLIDFDDNGRLFLDAKEVKGLKNAGNWELPDVVELPEDVKVIAVKGTNQLNDPGILASTHGGFIRTNNSWKCSPKAENGWMDADFDDSEWPKAYELIEAKQKPITGIREDASWIWAENYKLSNGEQHAYCRLKLP